MLHLSAHPALHPAFEALAYLVGYRVYLRAKAARGDVLEEQQRWQVIAAAAIGALAGSRVLGLLEQSPHLHLTWQQMILPSGGKTIVGGLLGGWIAVEITKKVAGISTRTGDLFAMPLCIGIAVGRIGCLLAGLADDTYGTPTSLPWAVDFGDGSGRHPTQAYELVFLIALTGGLHLWQRCGHPRNGAIFRIFLAAYLGWRLAIDSLKPQPLVNGLNAIQWACVAALSWLAVTALHTRTQREATAEKPDLSGAL